MFVAILVESPFLLATDLVVGGQFQGFDLLDLGLNCLRDHIGFSALVTEDFVRFFHETPF